MSIRRMTAVWEHSQHKGSELLLLLALADNADDEGYCWPGVVYLAEKIRMTPQSVIRLTKNLVASGELYARHNRRRGNDYVVRVGLDDQILAKTFGNKMGYDEKAICNILLYNTRVTSEVTSDVKTEVTPDVKTEVTPMLKEPSSSVIEPSIESSGATAPKPLPPPPKPSPKQSRQPTPAQEMFSAVAALCQIDLSLISDKDRGKLNTVSKRLREGDKLPQHLDQFRGYWYAADWRGVKGQAPAPHDILSNWGRAKEWLANGGSQNAGRNERRSKPVDAGEETKRQIEAEQSAHVARVLAERAQAARVAV